MLNRYTILKIGIAIIHTEAFFIGHALTASVGAISAIQRYINILINTYLKFADKKSATVQRQNANWISSEIFNHGTVVLAMLYYVLGNKSVGIVSFRGTHWRGRLWTGFVRRSFFIRSRAISKRCGFVFEGGCYKKRQLNW